MRIGVSAFAWTWRFDSRYFSALPALREHGISAFWIPMCNPRAIARARCAALSKTRVSVTNSLVRCSEAR